MRRALFLLINIPVFIALYLGRDLYLICCITSVVQLLGFLYYLNLTIKKVGNDHKLFFGKWQNVIWLLCSIGWFFIDINSEYLINLHLGLGYLCVWIVNIYEEVENTKSIKNEYLTDESILDTEEFR